MNKEIRIYNSFFLIDKLVGKEAEFKFFKFGRHMVSNVKIKLLIGDSIYKIYLIFIVKDDKYIVV